MTAPLNGLAHKRIVKNRVRRIIDELAKLYPDAKCALNYDGPLQLLVATILSAQCTDKLVNVITPDLFAQYPDVEAFATAKEKPLQKAVSRTNFFRNKAKNIILCCQQIMERHNGQVPATMEELTALRGLGRKSANVVLTNCFGVPGIPVDTHVTRLSQRMGLTLYTDPVKIEADLYELVPKSEWIPFGHRMIYHGRQVCHARKPLCDDCTLAHLCPKLGTPHADVKVRRDAESSERSA